MFFDPVYLLFALPGLLLALWASGKTKLTFERYSREAARSGLTGAEAARRLLYASGVGRLCMQLCQPLLYVVCRNIGTSRSALFCHAPYH